MGAPGQDASWPAPVRMPYGCSWQAPMASARMPYGCLAPGALASTTPAPVTTDVCLAAAAFADSGSGRRCVTIHEKHAHDARPVGALVLCNNKASDAFLWARYV